MQKTRKQAVMQGRDAHAEPVHNMLLEKIGSTTYLVNVYFSHKSDETLSDKAVRLVKSEVISRA